MTIAALLTNKKYTRRLDSASVVLNLLRYLPQIEYLQLYKKLINMVERDSLSV